jgi:hypothetical protein
MKFKSMPISVCSRITKVGTNMLHITFSFQKKERKRSIKSIKNINIKGRITSMNLQGLTESEATAAMASDGSIYASDSCDFILFKVISLWPFDIVWKTVRENIQIPGIGY